MEPVDRLDEVVELEADAGEDRAVAALQVDVPRHSIDGLAMNAWRSPLREVGDDQHFALVEPCEPETAE
jgi:hypothetical protein